MPHMRKIAVRKLTTSVDGLAYASDLAASVLLGCWAAGQCGAERPVMCGAGLRGRLWGGGGGGGELARMDFLTIWAL